MFMMWSLWCGIWFKNLRKKTTKQKSSLSKNRDKVLMNWPFLKRFKSALKWANDTVCGPDNQSCKFWNHLLVKPIEIRLNLLNDMWISGHFPSSMRKAWIIPVSKPDKDHIDPYNCNPIALNIRFCKTKERIINARLDWFFRNQQDVFVTVDPVWISLFDALIHDDLIKNEHMARMFFDLEKHCGTHMEIWYCKKRYCEKSIRYGLKDCLPLFLCELLSDGHFKLWVGFFNSDTFEQEIGRLYSIQR